ncbi:GNAT family N-acetyltransferase [Novosphingobium profundi]|uniref:GNAT family N-acetyltransferase n=1 Tax=Novosphingobium profundi TaxID=1774954 RepID=UPI001CFDC9A7|nr:GNAT family protein [Novosphingobium profundi]
MTLDFTELHGRHVELVQLSPEHGPALTEAVQDGELWRLWYTIVPSPEEMDTEIARRLDLQAKGTMHPFTVMDAQGVPVGMTSFMNIDAAAPRVEIGSTWYAARVQKTALNTEAKLLMLAHAFDQLDCLAVELRTHFMNHASRRAIERLGAKLDGVLRNHMRMADGSIRDTCVYSVTSGDWPAVRNNLEWQLRKSR